MARPLSIAMCAIVAGCATPYSVPVTARISAPLRDANASPAPASVVVPFTLDAGRIYVQVAFRRADGSLRMAPAWVNFGVGRMNLSAALRQDIGPGPVDFSIGGMPVRVDEKVVFTSPPEAFAQLGPQPVEAVLPAGLWPQFRVTLDYASRTLTLERASRDWPTPPGIPVPIRVNDKTGLVAVEAEVDGHSYPVVLDAGGGYSWWDGSQVRSWLPKHPDWYRADGAIGASNQAMVGENVEQLGTAVRVPSMRLGALELKNVGLLGTAPARGHPADQAKNHLFWKLWGTGAPMPVMGWLGANAMAPYRITFDYRNHVSYWLRTGPEPVDELNSVGVSLTHGSKNYFIGAVVTRHGAPGLRGVAPGDKLLAIDGRDARPMTRGQVIQALHGRAGESHFLTLERQDRTFAVTAPVEVVD
jgi:hypothetical protein